MAESNHEVRNVFHAVKITGEPGSIYKKVMIDGMEMKGIQSVTAVWSVDEMPRVFLEMVTTDLKIDEPLAAVLATIPKEEKDDH